MKLLGTFLACLALTFGPAWPASMAVLSGRPPAAASGQTVTDNFNRANAADMGANWTTVTGETLPFEIFNNTAHMATPNQVSDVGSYYSAVTWTANQSSEAKITNTGTSAGAGMGVLVRVASGARTFYRLVIDAGGNWELGRRVAGTFTSMATGTVTYSAGAVLKLSAIGTTITSTYNGSQIDSRTDSNIASGSPGVGYSSQIADGSVDDWSGSDGL